MVASGNTATKDTVCGRERNEDNAVGCPRCSIRRDKIPPAVQASTRERVEKYAAEHYAGTYTRLDIRFKGHFCYIDAYTEPLPFSPNPYIPESEDEYYERMRNIPIHLCRLSYLGMNTTGDGFLQIQR